MCLYDNEPHKVQSEVLTWGTYGKDGKQPLQYKTIAEMDTAHLEAVVEMSNVSLILHECMSNELKLRKETSNTSLYVDENVYMKIKKMSPTGSKGEL
jgi:hypothetical protein